MARSLGFYLGLRKRDCTIYLAKIKVLISCAVIMQLISAKSRLSNDGVHIGTAYQDSVNLLNLWLVSVADYVGLSLNRLQHPKDTFFQMPINEYWLAIDKSLLLCLDIYEPCCEKTGLQGFRLGPTQTGLCRRCLDA